MRDRSVSFPSPSLGGHQPEHLHRLGIVWRDDELPRFRVGSVASAARRYPDELPALALIVGEEGSVQEWLMM